MYSGLGDDVIFVHNQPGEGDTRAGHLLKITHRRAAPAEKTKFEDYDCSVTDFELCFGLE